MKHINREKIGTIHQLHWVDRGYRTSMIFGIVLLSVSLFSAYLANQYLQYAENRSVSDLLLDILPRFDVATFLLVGMVVFFVYLAFLCITKPKVIPFTLKILSLAILIRSIFIILTHLGVPTTYLEYQNPLNSNFFPLLLDDGFFFSGHVAIPFLLGLSFAKDNASRYIFFMISLIAAALVLIGRLHYSIDVFAAYFIGWGIFSIAKTIFRTDYRRVLAVER